MSSRARTLSFFMYIYETMDDCTDKKEEDIEEDVEEQPQSIDELRELLKSYEEQLIELTTKCKNGADTKDDAVDDDDEEVKKELVEVIQLTKDVIQTVISTRRLTKRKDRKLKRNLQFTFLKCIHK